MPILLNLGCGVKTSDRAVNIDWTIYLVIAKTPVLRWIAKRALSPQRLENLDKVGASVLVHDLRKGIPYSDNFVDAIYHSHLFEHIDRDLENSAEDPAILFTRECYRVLKKGGVLRIVVPDMEIRCREYVKLADACETDPSLWPAVDGHIHALMGQSAMRRLPGTSSERPLVRWLELAVLGDARKRGHTHQFEYDRFNLANLLKGCGFERVEQCDFQTSAIPDWEATRLDVSEAGGEYKPLSLYMEATK